MKAMRHFLFSPLCEQIVVILVVLNALFLGIETTEYVQRHWGEEFDFVDRLFILIFATEIALKIWFLRRDFFKSGWNIFDLLVVTIPLLSSVKQLNILRSLRILRLMRLMHFIPRFQKVIDSFLFSLPGIAGIFVLLLLIFYTFGVMGTALFGRDHPQFFGTLGSALFTVFQVATIGAWGDIARMVMETHPFAWVYFVSILICTALTVLNLITTLLIDSVNELREQERARNKKGDPTLKDVYAELQELKKVLKKPRK